MVLFRHDDPVKLLTALAERGVGGVTLGPGIVRLMTHHGNVDEAPEVAIAAIGERRDRGSAHGGAGSGNGRLRPPGRPRGVAAGAGPRAAKGTEVRLVVVNAGDKGSPDPATDPAELTERRAGEVRAAAAVLGLAGPTCSGCPTARSPTTWRCGAGW